MSLKVLYLHHYGVFGGASRSLLEMIQSFPPGSVTPHVLTPEGQFATMLRDVGVPVITTAGVSLFDHTRYGRYRGLRWLILLREILWLPATMAGLLRARRAWPDVDVVHVNEATMLPSTLLARWVFGRPVVLHVRSVMEKSAGWRDRLLRAVLDKVAACVAIDLSVRSSLPDSIEVHVVHNGLRAPAASLETAPARERRFTIAMVGNLLLVKGCREFVEAAAICRDRGLDIEFVFVGQSARKPHGLKHRLLNALGLSQEVEPEIRRYIRDHALECVVKFQGFETDLSRVYRSMDVICFPSHFDAPGRPIFEAAFFGVPSIAAVTRPIEDTIIDGKTGITIPPRSAGRLAEAIELLYRDADLRRRMGENARQLALGGFDAAANAKSMFRIYSALLAQPETAPAP